MSVFDLAVIGAGPAGSAAAITAFNRGLKVLLLEAGQYPRHKVCGEFVSAESAEVLRYLLKGGASRLFNAPQVTAARLHTQGRTCTILLASPGYSIPRITLDSVLWERAQAEGIDCRVDRITQIVADQDGFVIAGSNTQYRSRSVINAAGRWSHLTRRITRGDAWIGLKAHFQGDTDDAVDLYFSKCGYCGVQMVEPGILNACALVRQGTMKTLEEVFATDPHLRECSRMWRPVTSVFATAPVYLGAGSPLAEGVLQAGDAAGFVDPFVGDGISLALRSGVLAGRCAGEVSPEVYGQLYHRAFSGIFRGTNWIRMLQALPAFLHPPILRGLGLPAVAHRLFHVTRRSRLNVLAAPLEASPGH